MIVKNSADVHGVGALGLNNLHVFWGVILGW